MRQSCRDPRLSLLLALLCLLITPIPLASSALSKTSTPTSIPEPKSNLDDHSNSDQVPAAHAKLEPEGTNSISTSTTTANEGNQEPAPKSSSTDLPLESMKPLNGLDLTITEEKPASKDLPSSEAAPGDSGFRYPKNKDRFQHLNKWKEEKLQYVAQLKTEKSATIQVEPKDQEEIEPESSPVPSPNPASIETIPLQEGCQAIKDLVDHATAHEERPKESFPPQISTKDEAKPAITQMHPSSSNEQTLDSKSSASTIKLSSHNGEAEQAASASPEGQERQVNESGDRSVPDPVIPPKETSNSSNATITSEDLNPTYINRSQTAEVTQDVVSNVSSESVSDANKGAPSPHNGINSNNNPPKTSTGLDSNNTSTPRSASQNVTGSKDERSSHGHGQAPKNDPNSKDSSSSSSNNNTPKPSARRRLRKNRLNYASADCGAKVLAANDEAVDPSAVLVGSKDRYMLNPCSAPRQWIVIELCEEVGIDHMQIGNFEFFSSMIKEVQVLASNRYPTNSWALLGNFTLSNERELQSLDFGDESELFPEWFKYIKIRILSHWGKEFYCPITEIQVNGLPYVEKLQQELRQNSLELDNLEKHLKQESVGASTASPSPTDGTSQMLNAQGHSTLLTHTPDIVMPMHEYLEQHKLKTTEYFNTVYNTSLSGIEENNNVAASPNLSTTSKQSNPPSPTPNHPSSNGATARPDDVVHPGIPGPSPKIGADDEIEDTGEVAEEEASEKPEKVLSKISASAIPTMNLIQMIIQRVKALEVNQSLSTAYLAEVSVQHQDEISGMGEALAELNARYQLLLSFVANSSFTHAVLESRIASIMADVQNTNEFQSSMQGSMGSILRIYLLYSALLSLVICSAIAGLVVIILRCLPASEKSDQGNMFRSGSEVAWDALGVRSGSTGIYIKEDPLMRLAISPPSTPPPPEIKPEEKKTVVLKDFIGGHARRHSEPNHFPGR